MVHHQLHLFSSVERDEDRKSRARSGVLLDFGCHVSREGFLVESKLEGKARVGVREQLKGASNSAY